MTLDAPPPPPPPPPFPPPNGFAIPVAGHLQEVHLLGVSMRVPGEWSAAMWKALAGLPRLRELEVGVRDDLMRWIDINPPCADLRSFLRQLPKLKNVRCLSLQYKHYRV